MVTIHLCFSSFDIVYTLRKLTQAFSRDFLWVGFHFSNALQTFEMPLKRALLVLIKVCLKVKILLYHWVDLQKQRISHIKTAPIQLLPEIFENANNLLAPLGALIGLAF